MRLVRFLGPGQAAAAPRLGLEETPGGALVDLSAAEPALPPSMCRFLETPGALDAARRWVLPTLTLPVTPLCRCRG